MSDAGIQIVQTGTGKYRAVLQHGTTEISCYNPSATVLDDNVRNIIRLIVEAIGKGWFRADAREIWVVGPVHNTTGGGKDAKHITMTVKPGGKAKHLYILPNNTDATVLDTDTLDNGKPPGTN